MEKRDMNWLIITGILVVGIAGLLWVLVQAFIQQEEASCHYDNHTGTSRTEDGMKRREFKSVV